MRICGAIGVRMPSKVMVIVKIFPEGPDDVEKVEEALKDIKCGELLDLKKEPLAFGLSVIRVGIGVPDKQEGVNDAIEKELKNIEGIKEIEIEGATLI